MTENIVYRVVAKRSELNEDYPFSVQINGLHVAIFISNDQVYATQNICTHEYALLSEGFVDGENVECPLHNACFNFKTGKALSEPATVDLKTYPVRLEGDDVLLGLPT